MEVIVVGAMIYSTLCRPKHTSAAGPLCVGKQRLMNAFFYLEQE